MIKFYIKNWLWGQKHRLSQYNPTPQSLIPNLNQNFVVSLAWLVSAQKEVNFHTIIVSTVVGAIVSIRRCTAVHSDCRKLSGHWSLMEWQHLLASPKAVMIDFEFCGPVLSTVICPIKFLAIKLAGSSWTSPGLTFSWRGGTTRSLVQKLSKFPRDGDQIMV